MEVFTRALLLDPVLFLLYIDWSSVYIVFVSNVCVYNLLSEVLVYAAICVKAHMHLATCVYNHI